MTRHLAIVQDFAARSIAGGQSIPGFEIRMDTGIKVSGAA